MSAWHPNIGSPPTRGQHLDDKPIERVFVRLRNGTAPLESWPVTTGREPTTRWTLQGHSHDIMEWREA